MKGRLFALSRISGERRNLFFITGVSLAAVFFLVSFLAPWIAAHDPWERFDPLSSPGKNHLLGTNDLGHDIFSELVYGSRVSLIVGLGASLLATVIGLMVGLFSGYFRGAAEEILMGATDIFLMIPRIPLIIILVAFLKPSYWIITLVIGLFWWTSTARVVRSKTLQVREMNYIQSAKCLGFSRRHILFSEILPNILHVVFPKFMLTVAAAMISEASLSFLGLGDPAMKSWGLMMNYAFTKGGFVNGMWWWFVPPGICITGFVLSIVFISFALQTEEEREMGIR